MAASLSTEFTLLSDPKSVFAMLVNPEFLAEKVALAQSGKYSISGSYPDLTLNIVRNVESDLPAMVRKFIGETLVVEETQSWQKISDEEYLAKFELAIPNAPVQISGQISVTGKQETKVKITAQVKVSVPIFGAAAEPHVVTEIKKVLADEEMLCRSWISK